MPNALDKYKHRPSPTGSLAAPSEDLPQEEDGKSYLAYRPTTKARRLMVRRAREAHRAPGYQYLVDVMWDGDKGEQIGLVFSHTTILVSGKNLQDLAQQLAGEKVQFIQEFDPKRWPMPAADEPVITSIEYTSRVTGPLSGEDQAGQKKPVTA